LLVLGLLSFFVIGTRPPQTERKYLKGSPLALELHNPSGNTAEDVKALSKELDELLGRLDSQRTAEAEAFEALKNGTPTPLQLMQQIQTLLAEGKASSSEFQTKLDTLRLLMMFTQGKEPVQTSEPVFHDYLWPVMMLFFGGIIKFGLDWVLPQKKKLP
jgi:hypothetical protein